MSMLLAVLNWKLWSFHYVQPYDLFSEIRQDFGLTIVQFMFVPSKANLLDQQYKYELIIKSVTHECCILFLCLGEIYLSCSSEKKAGFCLTGKIVLKVFYLLLLETFSCQFEVVCDENTSLWFRDLILQPMPLILLLKNWLLLRLLEKVFAPNFITCLLSSIQLVLLFAHVIGFYWMFILKALELVLNPFRASYVQLYCLDTFWTTRYLSAF